MLLPIAAGGALVGGVYTIYRQSTIISKLEA